MTITECRQSTSTKQYIGLAVLLSDTVSHVFRGKCQFAVTRQILSGTCQESMRYCHDHCFRSFFQVNVGTIVSSASSSTRSG